MRSAIHTPQLMEYLRQAYCDIVSTAWMPTAVVQIVASRLLRDQFYENVDDDVELLALLKKYRECDMVGLGLVVWNALHLLCISIYTPEHSVRTRIHTLNTNMQTVVTNGYTDETESTPA